MVSTTLYHLPSSGAPAVSPAFDSAWTVTVDADSVTMVLSRMESTRTALADKTVNVPNLTSQAILVRQYVSDPIPPQYIGTGATLTGPIKCTESLATANATGRVIARVINPDGTVAYRHDSAFTGAVEFATTAATRAMSQTNTSTGTSSPGARVVVEFGVDVSTPALSTVTMRFGNPAGVADFANSDGLTTDLCPWFAILGDIYTALPTNYQSPSAGSGMYVSERVR